MAQSSAAREPTMEEILASIRRIIESNDQPTDGPALAAVSPIHDAREDEAQHAAPAGHLAAAEPAKATKETNRGPIEVEPETRDQGSFAPANQSARPISLADVAARLRGGPAAAQQVAEPSAAATVPLRSIARDGAFEQSSQSELSAAETPAELSSEVPAPFAVSAYERDDDDEPAYENDAQDNRLAEPSEYLGAEAATLAPASSSTSNRERDSVTSDDAVEPSGHALMSVATGSQVAAVFDGLGEAMKKSTMRSFDEIAQDMLRPMLSDWLDDNLPTLVERLVREEIERVARGGRR